MINKNLIKNIHLHQAILVCLINNKPVFKMDNKSIKKNFVYLI